MRRLLMCLVLVLSLGVRGQSVAELEAQVEALRQQQATAEKALAAARATAQKAKSGSVAANQTQFVIPHLGKRPVIDGVVNEEEWAEAITVPMAAGIFGMIARRSSTFYVGWDEEAMYFAQRLPLREGEKLLRLNREPVHDNVQPHENAVEVYVDLQGTGSHASRCRWQFMGNAVGNQWDREDQFEIGQNFVGWDGEWSYKQRLTPDGKYWEAEIAIPRTTVYAREPLSPGQVWWIGMATDLHRPWCFSGFYQWKIPATFAETTPVIRFDNVQRSHEVRGLGGDFSIRNTFGEALEVEVVAQLTGKSRQGKPEVVFEKRFPLSIAPGATAELAIDEAAGEAIKDEASYTISFMVLRGERSLYTWSYPIIYGHPSVPEGLTFEMEPTPFVLQSFYNPLSNYVRVVVDMFDFGKAEEVAKARFVIEDSNKQALGSGAVSTFTYQKAEGRVDVPEDLAPGQYTCRAELVGADGRVLSSNQTSFERKDHAKDFAWLGTAIGEEDILLKPFEPLEVRGNTVNGYRKQIVHDGSGLPARIVAGGVDLLARPIYWRGSADGKNFESAPSALAPKQESASRTRASYAGSAEGGPLRVESTIEWEYDGTAKVVATLLPAKLDRLQLVIPLREEAATHFMVNGLSMRLSNRAGRVPAKPRVGAVWQSTEMPYQKMTVGSFVPILWLGNLNSGITWFADSDEGWWPGDEAPASEIVRTANGSLEIVLNIAPGPVEISSPRRLTFGLNVNPVRPYSEHIGSISTFGHLRETGRWDPEVTKSKVFARRYPDNLALNKRYIEVAHKYGEIYAPYTEMSPKDLFDEEWAYFLEEWRSTAEGGQVVHCDSSNDNLLYWTKRWIDDAGLDGYYFDNVFNRLNWNTHAGTAYELPDGRVQPGYTLWGMREHIKRIRTVFQVSGRDPSRICIHNTRYQFAPIMGFADLAMGGEMATPRGDNPGAGDFMDMYPREFMEVMYNQPLWGYKLSHLYHFRPATYVDELGNPDEAAAMKVHRSAMATMLVHGVEFFQGINYKPFLANQWRILKQMNGGMPQFIPSWQANGLFEVRSRPELIDAAVYRGEKMLLVIVTNYDRKPQRANVWVDFPNLLAMPAAGESRELLDFETLTYEQGLTTISIPEQVEKLPRLGDPRNGHTTMHMANVLNVTVQPRDFRAILFINLPPSKGAGF